MKTKFISTEDWWTPQLSVAGNFPSLPALISRYDDVMDEVQRCRDSGLEPPRMLLVEMGFRRPKQQPFGWLWLDEYLGIETP